MGFEPLRTHRKGSGGVCMLTWLELEQHHRRHSMGPDPLDQETIYAKSVEASVMAVPC